MPLSTNKIHGSLNLIIDTFKELRPELMQSFGKIEHISKNDGSPVTELDVKVEKLIKQRLAEKYPEIGFHGEETSDTPSTVNATWIIDPIDGTSSFIHGLDYCTNMAGLVVDGEIVASVIYQFSNDILYTAIKDKGSYKNGKKMSVKNTELNNSIIFTGEFVYKNLYEIFSPHKIAVCAPLGASGYAFIKLAEGSIQGVTKLRSKAQIHDNVPGVLLARESGADIVSFDDNDYKYDNLNFIIGTPNFINIIKKHKDEIRQTILF